MLSDRHLYSMYVDSADIVVGVVRRKILLLIRVRGMMIITNPSLPTPYSQSEYLDAVQSTRVRLVIRHLSSLVGLGR